MFRPGERVRLRFINGSSMSIFDVRIDGLPMTVVQADGNDVEPVTVDEFRISVAETYDVIVQPTADRAYTIFAQAEDRSGYARGTLRAAPRHGGGRSRRWIPARCARWPTWAWAAWIMDRCPAWTGLHARDGPRSDAGHEPRLHARHHGHAAMEPSAEAKKLEGGVGVDNVAEMPTERLNRAGEGFPPGRRVLTYADLRAPGPAAIRARRRARSRFT